MDTIAVIDDRVDMRESVAGLIRLGLEDIGQDWNVVAEGPLESVEDYVAWINANDIRVLVLDEKLAEEIGSRGTAVDYSGHDVAVVLRRQLPDLPQLIVTSIRDSDELQGAAELDAIVQRDEFNRHANVYVERMVRMGLRYVERNEEELCELTEISKKIALGQATDADMTRLNAVREKVQRSVRTEDILTLREWLADAELVKQQLEGVIATLGGIEE